ncbi:DUF6499 domain-containing protein [Mesorhizobium sp. M0615]
MLYRATDQPRLAWELLRRNPDFQKDLANALRRI